MARIFMDGFESGGLDQFTSSSGATVVSTSGLSMDGNYCLECTGSGDYVQSSLSADDEMYFAFLYRPAAISYNYLISFYSGSSKLMSINFESGSFLGAKVDSSLVAVSSISLSANVTYLVEGYYKIANSGGRIVCKLNGIVVIDYTGDTLPLTYTQFNSVRFGYTGTNMNGSAYYDNIILDSANWIGKTYIQGLAVTGAGTTTQLTPSTGSNYTCVDEIPASDTDYVYSNTVDQLDTYAAGNLTGTIGTIKAVQVQSRVVKEGTATPQNVKLAVRSGATDYVSADKVVPTTAATVASIWETDPATSAAWSESNVNAVEIGVKTAA